MAQTNFVDGHTDHKRVDRWLKETPNDNKCQFWIRDILLLFQMSVLDRDVLEAAQEVVIVQAVQVLAHLALQKQTGKEHKDKACEA